MGPSAFADSIAESLLAWHHDSARGAHPGLDPVAHFHLIAKLALGRHVDVSPAVLRDAHARDRLRRAALAFIRRTQFVADADHYRLLGVAPDASMATIRENHRLLIQIVHPDRSAHDERSVHWPADAAARVNRAYFVLKGYESRAAYDLQRTGAALAQQAIRSAGIARPPVPLRRPPSVDIRSPLPEWLTASVGGFVRRHPTLTIFAALISACSLAIASVSWLDRGIVLTRGQPRVLPSITKPALAIDAAPQPADLPRNVSAAP